MVDNKLEQRRQTIDWVVTIIVVVLAILSIVIGVYGLIDGFNIGPEKVTWFCVPAIILGAVVAILATIIFAQWIPYGIGYLIMHIVWTAAAIGLLIVGIAGSVYIGSKSGLVWLPICCSINGGLLLVDKIIYYIRHFMKAKQPQQTTVESTSDTTPAA